jgi:hypothetical protein
MAVKALDMMQAYHEGKLPQDGGYIISSFFSENTAYSRYEVIAYPSVKAMYLQEDGLTFQSDGNKIFVLVEPPSYPRKYEEPFRRSDAEKIPHRFSELDILTTNNQTKIMVSKEPIVTYTNFTVFKPSGIDFAFVFFRLDDALDSMKLFFEKTLNNEAQIPRRDAGKAADLVIKGIQKFSIFDQSPD